MVDSAAYEKHSSFSCWTPVVKVGRITCPGLDLLAGGDGIKDVGHKFPERHYDMTATIGIIGAERLFRTKPNRPERGVHRSEKLIDCSLNLVFQVRFGLAIDFEKLLFGDRTR